MNRSLELEVASPRSTLKERAVGAAALAAMTTAFLLAVAGFGAYRFGSIEATIAYASGARVIVDARIKDLGDVPPGETRTLAYTISNFTGRPLALQGAQTSCTCALVEDLPSVVTPGGSRDIHVRVRGIAKRPRINSYFHLYTDDPTAPDIVLRFRGRTTVAGGGPGAG